MTPPEEGGATEGGRGEGGGIQREGGEVIEEGFREGKSEREDIENKKRTRRRTKIGRRELERKGEREKAGM